MDDAVTFLRSPMSDVQNVFTFYLHLDADKKKNGSNV